MYGGVGHLDIETDEKNALEESVDLPDNISKQAHTRTHTKYKLQLRFPY
jgi:hypothetical protein